MGNPSELYQTDYHAWAQKQAELLKAGRLSEVDISHLIEELQGMGASNLRELASRLSILLMHLLKWQFQYRKLARQWREFEGKSWRNTLIEQRSHVLDLLEENPSLQAAWEDTAQKAYRKARDLAAKETGLSLAIFPAACPYSKEQILDDGFYPAPE